MKTLARYTFLFLAIALWAGGCSRTVMRWYYQIGIITDEYRYGDLYRLTNLSQFKDPQRPCPDAGAYAERNRASGGQPGTHLYLIGDSFTEPQRISQVDFPADRYQYVHWDKQIRLKLDTSRRNVLLLETVERHFREHFSRPVTELAVVSDTSREPDAPAPALRRLAFEQIQSKGIEERLETVLFSGDVFLWFKELKAALTLQWFGRVPPTVGISRDYQQLFVDLDTDTTKRLNSSFAPLSDAEVDQLVEQVNATADAFKQQGFDTVALSIIPNKASILEPGRGAYNHLIERVQQHPRLRVPFVDVYTLYARQPQAVYARGDSHWNCRGRTLWLDAVNDALFPQSILRSLPAAP